MRSLPLFSKNPSLYVFNTNFLFWSTKRSISCNTFSDYLESTTTERNVEIKSTNTSIKSKNIYEYNASWAFVVVLVWRFERKELTDVKRPCGKECKNSWELDSFCAARGEYNKYFGTWKKRIFGI
jgi:hypothetical protein